ncbi:MAG TPA: GDP-mannose 4,6-dehydratase [Vitreimonas sp.]|nr:GDP-mannose 4,6-dehydratase [Vitreimonas sp.]
MAKNLPQVTNQRVMLITGITGMIGTHIADQATAAGYKVFGLARSSAASRLGGEDAANVFRCDILDQGALAKVFKKVKPDVVVHMAAQAFNGMSWEMETLTHQTNYLGTHHVLQCAREITPQAQVLLACSSAEYGAFDIKDCPLKETQPLHPITPYGVSKMATEALGFQFFHNYGMNVFLPRLFIHVGTGHPPATAIQNFARQLALMSKGKLEPVIKVGNLESARDFIDVRDGARALLLLLEKGQAGEAINICTGQSHKISDVLTELIDISGLDVTVESDPGLHRPSDEPLLVGDNSKLQALGWKQQYSLRETLTAVYQDWVSRI